MAKDQMMNLAAQNEERPCEDSILCMIPPGSDGSRRHSDSAYASQQTSDLTPSCNGYNGISPSTSSSVTNIIAPLSCLTSTSPSHHPSPSSRNATISGKSQSESPLAYHENSVSSNRNIKSISDEPKPKIRRGRLPKDEADSPTKITVRRKRQHKPKASIPESPLPQLFIDTQQSNFGEAGGLKMRFRRDFTVEEPVIGKKPRKRISKNNSAPVFRIVEAWCDADAPGSQISRNCSTSPSVPSLVSGGFRVGDVVWAKLAGYPYWPSRISELWTGTQQVDLNNPDASALVLDVTPADPSLAHEFTAKVEWFPWGQCSILSSPKLFPFQEYFDKLYTARTRVKGYNKAVEMAKDILSISSNIAADISEIREQSQSAYQLDLDIGHGSTVTPDAFQGDVRGCGVAGSPLSLLSLHHNPADLLKHPEAILEQYYSPLPQLDASCLDIVNNVPTFSEDEDEDNASFANRIKSQLGTIGL